MGHEEGVSVGERVETRLLRKMKAISLLQANKLSFKLSYHCDKQADAIHSTEYWVEGFLNGLSTSRFGGEARGDASTSQDEGNLFATSKQAEL